MAGSKVKLYTCCALALLGAVVVVACVAVLARSACPSEAFSRSAVAADSARCSRIGR